jgi:peptidoglycan/LPS O-acetylase OafA/YrhL
MSKYIQYRPDVDGLRAVAVISVFLFHLGFSPFSGGFIGVDIFFVISGFLITKIIYDEVRNTNEFDFSSFYIRRVRRLFPSMIAVLFITSLFSIYWFSPTQLTSFGASLVHAITSTSNIYFWIDSDYFDLASEIKPLLHTWSLSVEEQFYLIWPLLLSLTLIFRKKMYIISLFILLFILSFSANLYMSDTGNLDLSLLPDKLKNILLNSGSTLYYLTPFRIFEFVIGGALVFINYQKIEKYNQHIFDIVFLAGLILILYSIFFFNTKIVFPSYNALIPCLGAAFIILSGSYSRLNILLTNKLMVHVGLVSYTLYLVHWPTIVFYKYINYDMLTLIDYLLIVLIAILITLVIYKFIETPLRRSKNNTEKGNNSFLLLTSVFIMIVLTISSNIWATNGWIWRYDKRVQELAKKFKNQEIINKKYAGGSNCVYKYSIDLGPTCQTNQNLSKHVWIIGDSHGRHLTKGLEKYFKNINFKFIKNNCRFNTFDYCYDIDNSLELIHFKYKQNIIDTIARDNAPIIIAQTWIQREQKYIKLSTIENKTMSEVGSAKIEIEFDNINTYSNFVSENLETIKMYYQNIFPGRRIIVVGDVPRPGTPEGTSPIDCLFFKSQDLRDKCSSRSVGSDDLRYQFNTSLSLTFDRTNAEDIIFINPFDAFCKDGKCTNYTKDGYPVYIDNSHLSVFGSEMLVKELYSKLDMH